MNVVPVSISCERCTSSNRQFFNVHTQWQTSPPFFISPCTFESDKFLQVSPLAISSLLGLSCNHRLVSILLMSTALWGLKMLQNPDSSFPSGIYWQKLQWITSFSFFCVCLFQCIESLTNPVKQCIDMAKSANRFLIHLYVWDCRYIF